MSEFTHLKAADVRRVPWKNGRGMTEELAVGPAGASFERGDFDWRVSRSSVADAGPFSEFAGFDRVLVVTDGDGLVLDHGDAAPAAAVRPLRPYGFAGDWPTTAAPTNGPVVDFNVLVRRGVLRAGVRVSRPGRRPERLRLPDGTALVHVLVGPMIARSQADGRMFALSAGDSLVARGTRAGEELQLVGSRDDCVAMIVSMSPV